MHFSVRVIFPSAHSAEATTHMAPNGLTVKSIASGGVFVNTRRLRITQFAACPKPTYAAQL